MYSNWLLLTAMSVLFRSTYGVTAKIFSNKMTVSVYTQATLLMLGGSLITILASPLLGGLNFDISNINIVSVLLVVLGQGLGNIVYFMSIKNLTNGTAQVAFSSILIFNTLLSIVFLNLHLSALNIIGITILMIAVISVITGKIELHIEGVLLMIFSAFLFSIFQLSSSVLSKQVDAATYMLIAYLGSAITIFFVKWKTVTNDIRNSKDLRLTLGIPILVVIPSLGNFLFAYHAYKIAPEPSKVAMLLTSQVVFSVLLSYVFLKERGHFLRKLFAALLVIISAILIKG